MSKTYSNPKDDERLSDEEVLSVFKKEFAEMKTNRTEYEADRDICDGQMEANTYYDEKWVLQVNPPLEQSLCELSAWRMAGKMNYNLEPIGKKPIKEDSVVAKYTLAHYIRAEQMHQKIQTTRYTGSVYGTSVYFTGVTSEREVFYKIKEGTDEDDIFWTDELEKVVETMYCMTGNDVPLREVWFSADGLKSPNVQKATRAVMKRSMSLGKFKVTFEWDMFNTEWVCASVDVNPPYGENKHNVDDDVQLYYYYDQETKDFWIVANELYLVYRGYYHSKTRGLPFRTKQHYRNHKSLYGYGICHKVRYLKAYKAEMLQDLLGQSKMGGPNIITGNTNQLSSEYLNNPWEVWIRQFSGDVDKIKTFQYTPDIQKYVAILQVIDDLVVQDTWENLRATYEAVAQQLGTVEIIENARATRLASVDENDDLFLSEVLTSVLDNITQYAYKLQTKKTKNSDGTEEVEYPMIQVKWMRVIQDWSNVTFVEDLWEQWYFEFREEMIQGRYLVKVTTNSNVNTQKTLEKNSITQMITNLQMIASFRPDIIQNEDIQWLLSIMKDLNWFDEKYDVDTTRDKIMKEAEDIMMRIQQSLWFSQFNDPNATQEPAMMGQPTAWSAQPTGSVNALERGAIAAENTLPDAGATLRGSLTA